MSATIELYINSTLVPIDGDAGIRISKQLSDIREPDKRGTASTKTIKIPGSKEVNKLLGHIFDIRHRIQGSPTASVNFSPDFNPNLKATALLLVDGVEALKGFARLLDIVINGGRITYEIALSSESKDLFLKLEGKKLRDLNLTDLNHAITRTNISNSWATSYVRSGAPQAFAYGEGYVYPIMDQGANTLGRKFIVEDLYPALALREIMLAIFEAAGFSWSSGSFFNDTIFRHLYLPYPGGGMSLTEADLIAREFKATRITTDQGLSYGATLILQDDSTGSNFDSAGAWNTTTGIWTAPVEGSFTFGIDLTLTVDFTAGHTLPTLALFGIEVNGILKQTITSQSFIPSTTPQNITAKGQGWSDHFNTGDTVKIKFLQFQTMSFVKVADSFVVQMDIKKDVSSAQVYGDPLVHKQGEVLDFTAYFDNDKTQRDFLLDIIKAFNLWICPDPDLDKVLIIKTRDALFTSTILDWTQKLDESQDIKVTPLGELQDKRYIFTYSEGKDIANIAYLQRYGRHYGGYEYTVNNDFVNSTREIKIGFSPTPFINYGAAWDAVLPHTETTDGKPGNGYRLLYYSGLKTCGAWTILDNTTTGSPSTNYITYPFFGHVDSPLTPTLDLCFGMPREVSLDLKPGATYTNANLFNTYWRKQIEEITDPDSKIYTVTVRLTPKDWQAVTLRELVFISGEYFRINRLLDWDPVNDGLIVAELIKARTFPTFSGTNQRGSRGYDVLDPNGDRYPDVMKGPGTGGNGKPGSGGGDTIGGVGTVMAYPGGFNTGGQGNVALAPDVTFIGCRYCVAEPEALKSILLDCDNLVVSVPGLYFQNRRISRGYIEGGEMETLAASAAINNSVHIAVLDTSGGAVVGSLPAVATSKGRTITIIKSGASGGSVDAPDGAQIDGVAGALTVVDRVTLSCDGSDWHIITPELGTPTLAGAYDVTLDGGDFAGSPVVLTFI